MYKRQAIDLELIVLFRRKHVATLLLRIVVRYGSHRFSRLPFVPFPFKVNLIFFILSKKYLFHVILFLLFYFIFPEVSMRTESK